MTELDLRENAKTILASAAARFAKADAAFQAARECAKANFRERWGEREFRVEDMNREDAPLYMAAESYRVAAHGYLCAVARNAGDWRLNASVATIAQAQEFVKSLLAQQG